MVPATASPNADGRPVVLCGLGRVGWRVLDWLREDGQTVVVVDTNSLGEDPRLAGVTVIRGDCRRPDVLAQAGIENARGVLILTADDLVNVTSALVVRQLNRHVRIVVRMFNQNLLTRLGSTVKNTVALSIPALTAPLLALTAATGDVLGAFKLESGPGQVSEVPVTEGSDLVGRTIAEVMAEYRCVPLVLVPASGKPVLLLDIHGDIRLSEGDRLVIAGAPNDVRPLVEKEQGALFPGVLWAGAVRRWFRTAVRTLGEVDLSVKIITPVLFLTLFLSTLIFHYGFEIDWGDGLYESVSVMATGEELHGEGRPEWAKVFLSVLKLAGAALVAGFTAILTNYLIRARLGGALEVRRVPDGGHVVVCGLGNVGYRCVEELIAIGERVVAIDSNPDNPFIATCRRQGVPTFVGNATVPEVLVQARADTAKAVIASTSSELANLEIALLVRESNSDQRVVVRLSDPLFAQAMRAAANIRYAASIPVLAAPAFAAALFGDRVQTIFTAAGRTLVVVDLAVHDDDPCLNGQSLRAAAVDYQFLPLALNGQEPAAQADRRLKPGDRLTAVSELADLERLLRREPAPRDWSIIVEAFPVTAREVLIPLVRAARRCDLEEASRVLAEVPFAVAEELTRGEAEEMQAKLARERVGVRMEKI